MNRDQITPDILKELLFCEPLTGTLIWKRRDRKWFKSDRIWKSWNGKNADKQAFTADSVGYKIGAVFGNSFKAHRVIWAILHGEWPIEIDHINGDPGDNRLVNLRNVSSTENSRNMSKQARNKSGMTGVAWYERDKHWVARITVDRNLIVLGYFKEPLSAFAARKAAEIEHCFHPNHGRIVQ